VVPPVHYLARLSNHSTFADLLIVLDRLVHFCEKLAAVYQDYLYFLLVFGLFGKNAFAQNKG